MKPKSESQGFKLSGIVIIWGLIIGILAVSASLVSSKTAIIILSLDLIICLSGSLVAIWQTSSAQTTKISELTKIVKTLNKRVVELETVLEAIYENHELKVIKNFKNARSSDRN
ncbi:MAG: hypothetical protein ACRC2R_01395 [Xenococcaceae cyanobacterium]